MRNKYILFVLVAVSSTSAFAQNEKWDLSGDYSYLRFNPSITGINTRSFNGGGGAFQYNFTRIFGIKADLQGYGSTSWTKTVTTPIVTPHGTIPAGSFTSNGNQFTWMFGPVIRIPAHKVTLFGEVLFGGSNTNAYGSLEKAIDNAGGTIQVTGTQHPFTMVAGGGLDINVSKVVALRLAEVDYVLTRYSNPLTNTNNQNNFRYLAGIIFKFGGAQ